MSGIQCPFPACDYVTDTVDGAVAAAQLNIHALTHRAAVATNSKQKPPKIERPTISRGSSEEEWNLFQKKWTLFKNGTSIPAGQVTTQLWQCCDAELESDLFKDVSDISVIDELSILDCIKRLAVIKIAASVRHNCFL